MTSLCGSGLSKRHSVDWHMPTGELGPTGRPLGTAPRELWGDVTRASSGSSRSQVLDGDAGPGEGQALVYVLFRPHEEGRWASASPTWSTSASRGRSRSQCTWNISLSPTAAY